MEPLFFGFFGPLFDPLCQGPPNHHKYDISGSYWTGILDTTYPIIPIPPKTTKTRQKGVKNRDFWGPGVSRFMKFWGQSPIFRISGGPGPLFGPLPGPPLPLPAKTGPYQLIWVWESTMYIPTSPKPPKPSKRVSKTGQKRVKNHDFGSFLDHFLDPSPHTRQITINMTYLAHNHQEAPYNIPTLPKTPKTSKTIKKGSKTGQKRVQNHDFQSSRQSCLQSFFGQKPLFSKWPKWPKMWFRGEKMAWFVRVWWNSGPARQKSIFWVLGRFSLGVERVLETPNQWFSPPDRNFTKPLQITPFFDPEITVLKKPWKKGYPPKNTNLDPLFDPFCQVRPKPLKRVIAKSNMYGMVPWESPLSPKPQNLQKPKKGGQKPDPFLDPQNRKNANLDLNHQNNGFFGFCLQKWHFWPPQPKWPKVVKSDETWPPMS